MAGESRKQIAKNSKAFHDYFVEDKYEAGIELAGTEVKSIRMGNVNLKDAFCTIKDGQMTLNGMHVSPYEKGNIFNREPRRPRRLLMHKREILKLQALAQQDGMALIPLSVYFKNARVKVEVGVCRGKKNYDKRDATAKRDAKRDMDRAMKHDYFVEDKYEAGIELAGTEVKSIRMGNVNLKDAFCTIKDGQMTLNGMHVSPYEKGNIFNREPRRPRRLLMHKREILKLQALAQQDGMALIPLSVYFKNARVKVEVGVCRGKKNYDKRDATAKRDAKRDMDRAMKTYNR